MQPARLDLRVIQGATLRKPLLLMQPHYVYLPITAIQQTAPLRLTVPAHGMPDGWPCWLEGTAGWAQLNRDKLREPFRIGAVVDANTIEFNALNGKKQSASGGDLVYQPPVDLGGCTGELRILFAQGVSLTLSTGNGGLVIEGPGRLLLVITAAQVAGLTSKTGTYDLTLTMSNGDPLRWAEGVVSLSLELSND